MIDTDAFHEVGENAQEDLMFAADNTEHEEQ